MSDIRDDEIRATIMSPGQLRIICPYCYGGSNREPSMLVWMDEAGAVAWKCFRATCGTYGGNRFHTRSKLGRNARIFTADTRLLNLTEKEYLRHSFKILDADDWRYCEGQERYVIPIKSPEGKLRGVVARSFAGGYPKALTYLHTEHEPRLGWVRPMWLERSMVVLVEDLLSATRVAQAGEIGCALLGTSISLDGIDEVVRVSAGKQVVVALDADAFGIGIEIAGRLRPLCWPPPRVAKLRKDLKDETEEALEKFLDEHADEREPTTEGNDK